MPFPAMVILHPTYYSIATYIWTKTQYNKMFLAEVVHSL